MEKMARKCWETKSLEYDKRYKTLKEEYLDKDSNTNS